MPQNPSGDVDYGTKMEAKPVIGTRLPLKGRGLGVAGLPGAIHYRTVNFQPARIAIHKWLFPFTVEKLLVAVTSGWLD